MGELFTMSFYKDIPWVLAAGGSKGEIAISDVEENDAAKQLFGSQVKVKVEQNSESEEEEQENIEEVEDSEEDKKKSKKKSKKISKGKEGKLKKKKVQ